MVVQWQPALVARNGRVLKVLGIARISTDNQDERSLTDQEALYRRWLDAHVGMPHELTMIASKGSGEDLLRPELLQMVRDVETGNYDLVLTEDLARICRRSFAREFCGICLDHDTRLIALNDHVDTGRDDWHLNAFFASFRHELYNQDTSKRIRRSLRNRFEQGGLIRYMVFGIIKPPGAKTDADLYKDPAAQPIYDEMERRLYDGASYEEVADWLNEKEVPPGPCARSKRWTGTLVGQLLHNQILKGIRVHNDKINKRINATGKRKAVKAPLSERLERHCPHLAFFETARYDRLIAFLDARNCWAKHNDLNSDGSYRRTNVPRKRTIWPGQHLTCGVCGRLLHYGGHGRKLALVCSGVKNYRCWNVIAVDSILVRERVIAAITAEISRLPDYDPVLLDMTKDALRLRHGKKDTELAEVRRRRAKLTYEKQKVVSAIKEVGHSPTLLAELKHLEGEDAQLAQQQDDLERRDDGPAKVPSIDEIRAQALKSFAELAVESPEFGRLLQRLARIEVVPYRLVDGGDPVLRAHVTLSLATLLPPRPELQPLTQCLERSLTIDLFDPPKREELRPKVMATIAEAAAKGVRVKQRDIAAGLKTHQMVVFQAIRIARLMKEQGITDPYQPLLAPPDDYTKWRRHRHPRFRFEPKEPPTTE